MILNGWTFCPMRNVICHKMENGLFSCSSACFMNIFRFGGSRSNMNRIWVNTNKIRWNLHKYQMTDWASKLTDLPWTFFVHTSHHHQQQIVVNILHRMNTNVYANTKHPLFFSRVDHPSTCIRDVGSVEELSLVHRTHRISIKYISMGYLSPSILQKPNTIHQSHFSINHWLPVSLNVVSKEIVDKIVEAEIFYYF